MNQSYQKILHDVQQADLLSFISNSLQKQDFSWTFDLYTIFYVLFPDEFSLAFTHIIDEISKSEIHNSDFEFKIIKFTTNKLHLIDEPVEVFFKTIDLLLEQKYRWIIIKLFDAFSKTSYYNYHLLKNKTLIPIIITYYECGERRKIGNLLDKLTSTRDKTPTEKAVKFLLDKSMKLLKMERLEEFYECFRKLQKLKIRK